MARGGKRRALEARHERDADLGRLLLDVMASIDSPAGRRFLTDLDETFRTWERLVRVLATYRAGTGGAPMDIPGLRQYLTAWGGKTSGGPVVLVQQPAEHVAPSDVR